MDRFTGCQDITEIPLENKVKHQTINTIGSLNNPETEIFEKIVAKGDIVFYPIKERNHHFRAIESVVCKNFDVCKELTLYHTVASFDDPKERTF